MTTPTVLLIEDDAAMRAGIQDNLELEGFRVLSCATARAGREAAIAHQPDLVILDLMLPDGDGIDVCRKLRASGFEQPIILLTARGEERDRILGFEVGADDYVVKPFSLRELLARVNAHLRRALAARNISAPVAVGVAIADFKRHQLTRDGQTLDISTKEMDLLRILVEHRGEPVSRESLLMKLWGYPEEVATRTVDNFIVRLRKKIEPNPAEPRYLITVHGRGYKLVEQ